MPMPFLNKKLFLKFLVVEACALALTMAVWWFLPNQVWIGIIGMALFNVAAFWGMVSHPFKLVLREVKALLTGKRYNRIYTEKVDEIGVIAHFFNEITRSLERVSTDIQEHRRISSELNIAQKIQKDLIPQTAPNIQGLDIIAKTKPAAEIGGDSFDFITKNDRTFLYIGDVTGHGVPSGLVMMIVYTLIHTFTDMVENGHQLLTQVNKYLKPRIQSTMFMTMLMFRWEHQTQEMFFAGAGHETLLHYKALEGKVENLKSGGIALGMVPNIENLVKESPLPLQEGDFLILYTDGIVEAKNNEGQMFGLPRLIKVIEKFGPKATNAEFLLRRIAASLTHFLGEHIQQDDMTLLVIRRSTTQPALIDTPTKGTTQWESNEDHKSLIDYENEIVKESGLNQQK